MIARMILHYDGVWEDRIHNFCAYAALFPLTYDLDELHDEYISIPHLRNVERNIPMLCRQ